MFIGSIWSNLNQTFKREYFIQSSSISSQVCYIRIKNSGLEYYNIRRIKLSKPRPLLLRLHGEKRLEILAINVVNSCLI